MPTRVFIAVVVLMSVVARIGGQEASERETLRGLGPIRVVVEELCSDAERDGLTQRMLQTAVELRLRQNGIPLEEDVALPYLYVNVSALEDDELYAFAVLVVLKQRASLSNGLTVYAATWNTGRIGIGMVGRDNLRNVRESVLEKVNEFSNDYLAVNAAP